MNLENAVIPEHAVEQMAKRGINEQEVRSVLKCPDSIDQVREGRIVAQSRYGKYVLRVFVDIDRVPPEIVTAYRTSKIAKYWSRQ